ncbi:MAG: V4R domain-containing protein [Lachnospiraceae bacterium]
MANIFMKESHNEFSWEKLGDIAEGRNSLGEEMPVLVYRLLQYCVNDILYKECGEEKANEIFHKAGHLAGMEFAKNVLPLDVEFDLFVAKLQETLKELKIGIMRIEEIDSNNAIILTIAEDLDCSGLPPTDEVVCTYDEGFLSGILEAYTGKNYEVREIDCWASGDRVCRFKCDII